MAQLCSAVDDGHLFIRVGPNHGTEQVKPEGIAWLRKQRHTIPLQGEGVFLDYGTYLKLKNMGYLETKGIEYDKNRQAPSAYSHYEELVVEGIPLVLRLKEHTRPGWDLALDLSELNEDARKELQSHHTDFITASDAITSISQKQLIYIQFLLRVQPRQLPYQIYRENSGRNRHRVQQIPETPGLNTTWKGNVFIERKQQRGVWQRRLPGSTISFLGELLWLAKTDWEHDWPGKAERIGTIYSGWQLWHLTVNEEAPVSWESLQEWFKYRLIDITTQQQSLEIISPPMAITEDGYYIVQPGKQILIACYPPSHSIQGLDKQAVLSAELVDRSVVHTATSSKVSTLQFPTNQVSYVRWSALHPGDYRIRLQGDASAEPLLVQVTMPLFAQPIWLRGLTCTIISTRNQQVYQAFNTMSDSEGRKEVLHVNQFSLQELPILTWAFEPEGLPLRVTWNAISQDGVQKAESASSIQSSVDLTRCWQEQIWPTLTASREAKITLDAGSYGCIELPIVVPQPPQTEKVKQFDQRLVTQFIWLSRMIAVQHHQSHMPVPISTRNAIRSFCTQVDTDANLSRALEKLSLANTLPAWVLTRLHMLLSEVEELEEMRR